MSRSPRFGRIVIATATLALCAAPVFGHGNVNPTPFATPGLPDLGDTWKKSDPFLNDATAIKIGQEGFKENCAACHGLDMESGGMAPDLHYLPTGQEGDDIYLERVQNGVVRNGQTKMQKYSGIVSQTGLWAIRAYIEKNHQDN